MKNNRIIIHTLFFLFIMILSIGVTSAESKTISVEISANSNNGDAYQINNYVVDVAFVREQRAIIDLYELKESGDPRKLDFTTFTSQVATYKIGDTTIIVEEVNTTTSKTLVKITVSGITIEYEEYVEGGLDQAVYIGEPLITLVKEVDKTTAKIGDTIIVNVKAKNTGHSTATQIYVTHGLTGGFKFGGYVTESYPSSISVGDQYTTLYTYKIIADDSGTFNLEPASITYYSGFSNKPYPKVYSDSPAVTVAAEVVETSVLDLQVTADETKLKRGDTITFTIHVENQKDVPASTIRIDPIIPGNMTYVSGSEDINIISEKPVIQESVYGARYEKDYTITLRADEIGSNELIVKLTYDNGTGIMSKKEISSGTFYIEEGEFDYLAEYPLYIYLMPILIVVAIAGWLYWRRNQYRM